VRRALVTGATGFLGQALCRLLAEEGTAVTAVSRGQGRAAAPGARAVVADVADPASLETARGAYDEIYHLAGLVSFDPAMAATLAAVNAGGTDKVLQAARDWGAGRVVVVSSACTIGLSRSPDRILDETAVAQPELARRNPYLASKLAAEALAREAAGRGQDVVVVNPTTVYGPGDYTLNSGSLVLSVAKSAVVPAPPGGSNVSGLSDTVAGMVAAARHGRSGERYILGGANLRFAEIVAAVAGVVGKRPLVVPVPRLARPFLSLAARLVQKVTKSRLVTPQIIEDLFSFKFYSNAKACRELGWAPAQSFEQAVAQAWDFYRREGLA
jgi:dihydroflavonol-4-reductase